MENKEFTIETTKRRFFRQYLELLRGFPPLNILRSKELDLLGELLYYNDRYKALSPEDRTKIIYDTATRNEMREVLEMTEASFNNNLSILRKRGVVRGNTIAQGLIVTLDDEFNISFKFKVE